MWNVQLKSTEGEGSNPNSAPTIYAMSNAINQFDASILRADPTTGAIQTFYNLEEPPRECSAGVEQAIIAPFTLMKSFALDPASDDIYVTWSGYVCNCSQADCIDGSSDGFDFNVGVSRLDTSNNECVLLSDNYAKASWKNCTTVVATLTNGCSINNGQDVGGNCIDPRTNTSVTLSDSGFAVARSELTGQPQFFVSMLVNSYPSSTAGNAESSTNEVWVINMGGSPETTQKNIDPVSVNAAFSDSNIQDAGTIQLRLDEQSFAPVGMCRTAYDAGIFCQDLKAENSSGTEFISVSNSTEFLSASQLNETCFVEDTDLNLPTVATGLAVAWPDIVYFGCFPSYAGVGNFSSVTRDGTLSKVLDGAYPGSILFGVDLQTPHPTPSPTGSPTASPTSAASHWTVVLSAAVALSNLFLVAGCM